MNENLQKGARAVKLTNARPPAMSDVADVAGVSHQTVSRVLNNHPHVRPETRTKVLAAIEQLGYRRNSAARTLVTRRSAMIGVITSGSALFGPTSTLTGVEVAAREAGFFVSLATIMRFDVPTMTSAVDHLLSQGVEAIIVIAPQDEVAQAVTAVGAPVPVVMISATEGQAGLDAVSVDQEAGARLAVRHLTELGHREVIHLAGPQDWFDARARLAGWRAECAEAGIALPAVVEGDWTAEHGYAVGQRMAREGAPSAVFAANDQLALGLLRAFWEAGLTVPDDVSVVGYDDVAGAAFFIPPLTTVRQDFAALGHLAIDALAARLAGNEFVAEPILPTLQVRASTAVPRAR